jgi:predicted lysophospholipase L1 biosynthesis ABC-type transport system permease subunit
LSIIFVIVPLLAAFLATLLVKSHTAELRFNYASATSAALVLGIAIGLVAGTEMLLLADFSGGSIGPGRMTTVGATPWLVGLVTFAEVTISATLAAFFSARPEDADRELIQKVRRLK